MKIILIGSFPLDSEHIRGGVEASVWGLAQTLAEAHHQVLVADMPRKGLQDRVEPCGDIVVHRFENNGGNNIDGAKRAADICDWIAQQQPHICHLHGTGYASYCLHKLLKKKGLPTILTVHGLICEEKKKQLAAKPSAKLLIQYLYQSHFERKLITGCKKVVVDTPYVATTIQKRRKKTLPLTVIPQGIDQKYFQIECSVKSKEILSVGSFSPRKGHLHLIQAIEPLLREHGSYTLNIAGNVGDREYYDKAQLHILEHHLSDRIHLFPDADLDTIHQLYSRAHLFCLHSFEESQGIVLAEAMGTGLPIVATNVGGVPCVVHDKINGLLTDTLSPTVFAANVLRLMQNEELWRKISASNRTAASQYRWDFITKQIENEYEALLLP